MADHPITKRRTGALTALLTTVLIAAAASCGGSEPSASTTTPGPVVTSDTSTPSSAPTSSSTVSTTAPAASTNPATTNPASTTTISRGPTIDELIGTFALLAHAGGDQEAPHSTRFAFEQAVAAGANVLELDVQLTADGVLVVQHDDTVDKTTEATGPVATLTLADIQMLDNAYWFSPACWPCQDRPAAEYIYRGVRTGDIEPPNGFTADDFRVPTFREIAEAFPQVPLDIEIKGTGDAAAAAAAQLANEIVELGRTDSVVVVSFDDAVVDVFREAAPDVETSPGLQRLTAWFLGEAELEPEFRVLQLPPKQGEIEIITAELVERIHAEGRIVWVWPDDAATQENEAFYRTLIDLDVDGIIAGRPTELSSAAAG